MNATTCEMYEIRERF